MSPTILVIILGVVSSATLILSALSVHRRRLLMFGIATSVNVAVQYTLVGSWTALGTLLVGLSWSIFTIISLKYETLQNKIFIPLFCSLHLLVFTYIFDWNTEHNITDYIPVVAGMLGVIAISFSKVLYTKAILLFVGTIWVVYQGTVGLYGQMVGETLTFAANLVAFITLVRAAQAGINQEEVNDIDTQIIDVITHNIEVVTGSITLPTGQRVPKPVRGYHPASVHYARRVEEFEQYPQPQTGAS